MFRFHTGSIKRVLSKTMYIPIHSFDSILVRLKEWYDKRFDKIGELVSIPYWFD